MSKTYRSYDPNQQFPLPVAMQEWLPPDHLSYFISDIVDHLDLSAITRLGRVGGVRACPVIPLASYCMYDGGTAKHVESMRTYRSIRTSSFRFR